MRCTGFTQHPVVTGGRPINQLTGLGAANGGYHRSHGQVMDGSGGFTIVRPNSWLTAGLELDRGALIGTMDSVVGYECDGCAWKSEPEEATSSTSTSTSAGGRVVPTGVDGTPLHFVIVGQALSTDGQGAGGVVPGV
jgi:hypothetical protein